MANQFHRLQTQAELHRPERTGFGDPNLKTFVGTDKSSFTLPTQAAQKITVDDLIFNPEDGQLYQDLNTGDLYRYIKFGTVPLEGEQGTFIGKLGTSKATGTEASTLSIVESEARTDSGLTVVKGQKVSIQTTSGDIQVLRASETQTFVSPIFTLKVNPFFYEFDAGEDFSNPTDVVSFSSDGVWEKFIDFDKSTGLITNVAFKENSDSIGIISEQFGGEKQIIEQVEGATFWVDRSSGLTFDTFAELEAYLISVGSPQSEWSGRITNRVVEPTQEIKFLAREVTEIKANLYAQLTEGEEITVYSPATGDVAKLTINDDGNEDITSYGPGENITIDIQDDKIRPVFPAGSLIFGEEGFRESSIKVDPSRIQLNVLGGRGGDGIGTLATTVGVGSTSQLSLKNIDETVNIKDNQSLILLNKFGDVKKLTANGAQTLSAGTDTLNIDSITIASGEPTFESDTAIVKEPSYSTSSRITVQDDSITSAVNLATDAVNASNAIEQRVSATESSITQSVQFNEVSGQVRLVAGPGGSEFNVTADQINIDGTTTFSSGYDPSTKETPAGAQSKADAAKSSAITTARNNVASNMGYADYNAMVAAATAGNTIIDGGFIRTSLIEADDVFAETVSLGSGGSYNAQFQSDGLVFTDTNIRNYFGPQGVGIVDNSTTRIQAIIPPAAGARTFRVNDSAGSEVFGVITTQATDEVKVNGDLTVDGNITYTGSISQTSDANLKENVVPLGPSLDKIVQLEAKIYDMVDGDEREIGLFAQDVESLFPEAVRDRYTFDEDGGQSSRKTLSYIQLVPALIESIKELKQQNEELKTRIEALEQQS